MKKIIYSSLFALLTVFSAQAQQSLSLEECINIALDNNLNIKRSRNNAIAARAGLLQSKLSFLPSLNASSSASWSEGSTLNTAFERVSVNNWNARSSINTSVNIFNGFATINGLSQSKFTYEAALDNIDNNILTTKISVVVAYLQVIQGKENLRIAQERLDILEEQLAREEKREAAGVGNMEQVYNFRSQVANQKLSYVNSENQLKSNELALIQLLLLDPAEGYEIQPLTVAEQLLNSELPQYAEVFDKSVAFSPSIKAQENTLKASEKGVSVAKGSRYPSLSASAGYGTRWASSTDESFFDQYDLNQNKGMSFSLNIPIFNNGRTSGRIQQAKVNKLNSDLQLEQTKNTLTNLIQQAYLDLVNAQSQYRAASENLVALENSFQFSKRRYESGTIDFVTYLQNLNAKNQGELQLSNAKYAFLIRDFILKLYMGQQVSGDGGN